MKHMNPIKQHDVPTKVRYLAPEWRDSKELARIFDRDSRRANTVLTDVLVRDARLEDSLPVLDSSGFELFDFNSPIKDFSADDAITAHYYPAIAQFVRIQTGADEVYVSQHLIRTEDKSNFNKAYARFVHCDYSMSTARSASLTLIENRKLDPRDYKHADFAWYNSWQPFDNVVQQNPLAMLDARTIEASDIQEYVYGGYGKSSKSSIPAYREGHQFYYYANMTPDEVLLIKQMDTRTERAAVAPHTSFIDSNSPVDAPPRRSIEVRMMAVFK